MSHLLRWRLIRSSKISMYRGFHTVQLFSSAHCCPACENASMSRSYQASMAVAIPAGSSTSCVSATAPWPCVEPLVDTMGLFGNQSVNGFRSVVSTSIPLEKASCNGRDNPPNFGSWRNTSPRSYRLKFSGSGSLSTNVTRLSVVKDSANLAMMLCDKIGLLSSYLPVWTVGRPKMVRAIGLLTNCIDWRISGVPLLVCDPALCTNDRALFLSRHI